MGIKLKFLILFLSVTFIFTSGIPCASAAVPYKSYNYDSYGEVVETADIYVPSAVISGETLNVGGFMTPRDIFVTGDILYILDSGNSRVIRCNLIDDLVEEIIVTDGVNGIDITKSTGIYVDSKKIYIADSGNQCIWATDLYGKVQAKIIKPETEYFEDALEFLPRKVVGDSVGNIYVQCTGVYEGLIIFNSNYSFSGFFGSEKVQTTSEILRNYFWKQFMTEEQKNAMANYVPSEIYSMDISAENFLYTITPGSLIGGNYLKETPDSIRCLNPKGSDVLESTMPKDVENALDNDNRYLNFIDISYSESGFINVIDNRQGRVYQFDKNMQLVTAFGGLGNYNGTFQQPAAVESYNEDIIVLDSVKNTITFFSLSKTGETIHKALKLYNNGNYSESLEPWYEVIEANPNFQLAYIGAGNALYNEGEYLKAMKYYETARDTTGYSNAYREYRTDIMRNNFIWIILFFAAVCVAVKIIKVFFKKRGISVSQKLYATSFGVMLYAAFHPVTGFDFIRSHKLKSKGFILFVFVLLVLLGVCEQQYMGKAFNIIDSSKVSIINIVFVRFSLLLLFVISNWAFSELMNGKASFWQICIFTSAALIPYIISGFSRVLLSRFLVENEAVFMSVVLTVGIICSFIILMIGFSAFHEFEIGKSIFSFVVTVIGMALILVLAFLIYNLTQNVVDFVKTIFSEMLFRLNT